MEKSNPLESRILDSDNQEIVVPRKDNKENIDKVYSLMLFVVTFGFFSSKTEGVVEIEIQIREEEKETKI